MYFQQIGEETHLCYCRNLKSYKNWAASYPELRIYSLTSFYNFSVLLPSFLTQYIILAKIYRTIGISADNFFHKLIRSFRIYQSHCALLMYNYRIALPFQGYFTIDGWADVWIRPSPL